MATITDLTIGGVKMPVPALEGVTISEEPIWSPDTGRTATGKMTGTIVAVKTTLQIKWPTLSMDDLDTILAAVSDKANPFKTVKYTDGSGAVQSKTMYFGTPSYTVYSYADGLQFVTEATVTAIEQ